MINRADRVGMKLYKFRGESRLEYLFDIVLNERLYCATYPSLNDPFEGQLLAFNKERLGAYSLFQHGFAEKVMTDGHAVPAILEDENRIRICSLSAAKNDVRMWSYYADDHKGVAVELELDPEDKSLIEVSYYPDLLVSMDMPKEMDLEGMRPVLSRKTKHWEFESEYRILNGSEYFSVVGCVTKIILGWRASELTEQVVRQCCGDKIQVVRAALSHESASIIFE